MTEESREAFVRITPAEMLQLMGFDADTHKIHGVFGYDIPDDEASVEVWIEGPSMPLVEEPGAEAVAEGDDAPIVAEMDFSEIDSHRAIRWRKLRQPA